MADRGCAAWMPALLLLAASTFGTGWIALRPPEQAGAPVAAIFPPWWDATRSFAAAASAGASIVRPGAWPAILVVTAPDAGLSRRLHAAGAWFLVNPMALAACLPPV
jgi:hypothetical protein